jgi:glycosyltransferase involved in cell wall biosynthesis
MKIWFIEIGEPLPIEADARLLRYGMLTKELASMGHQIVWWTSSFSHATKKQVCDHDTDIQVNGLTLRVICGPGYKRNISYSRVKHQNEFAKKFARFSAQSSLPQILISPIPTIKTSKNAVDLAKKSKIPVLIDIRDEWPDELVNLAPAQLRWLVRLFFKKSYRQMHYICQNATGIIANSRRQLEYGLSFAGRTQGLNDRFFPHGYLSQKLPVEKIANATKWWKESGIKEDAFVCCFFGTIGKYFDLGTVIRAADILSKEFPIQIVLCGNGSHLKKYRKMAASIDSVYFPGWVDAPKIAALMQLAHVGLAPYAASQSMSLPNKPIEYFSGGLPVVSSIQGELKDIISHSNCGVIYEAFSIDSLCAVLRRLNRNKDLRFEMGKRARQLFEDQFSIERIAHEFNEYLNKVVNRYNSGGVNLRTII